MEARRRVDVESSGVWAMIEATFVLFARKAQLPHLRAHLEHLPDEAVQWKERRSWFGSEFSVSGPAALARQAHQAAVLSLTTFGPR